MPDQPAPPATDTVRLQVAGAQNPDVGKGAARISQDALDELGLGQGGIIEILGKRTTAAVALPPYPQDEGLGIIRLDGLQRMNVQVGLGDHVEIREGRDPPGEEGHRRPGAEEHPAHRARRGADADAPRPPAHRRRRDLDERLPQAAGDGRRAVPRGGHARVLPAARLRPAGDPADGDLDEPARHRAGHAGDRDRAAPAVRRARGGHAARHHLRRRRRARQDDRPGARDGRAAAQAPRAVPPPRHRPAEGRAAPRPARHRQDPARPGGRQRERRAVLPHRRARDHGPVLRRERGAPAGGVRGGAEERAVDHLHRRDRLDRAQPGRDGRGRAPRRRPAADADGRAGAAPERRRHRRHEPASTPSTRRCAGPAGSTARSSSACPTSRAAARSSTSTRAACRSPRTSTSTSSRA